jgi:uncharacterized protein YbaR (Trm112 family)
MVLIFGWGAGEAQDLGEVAPAVCPNCHNHVYMHHIRSEKKVSLYFVPLIPYGTDEYLACPTCRQGLQIRPEQHYEVENMQAATSQFRRGKYLADAYTTRVERFWRAFGVAPSGNQVVHPSRSAPPPRAPTPQVSALSPAPTPPRAASPAPIPSPAASLDDRLRELAKLHANGMLTDEEFAAAKRHVLEI